MGSAEVLRTQEANYAKDLALARTWIEQYLSTRQPDKHTGLIGQLCVLEGEVKQGAKLTSSFTGNGFDAFLAELVEMLQQDGFFVRLEQQYRYACNDLPFSFMCRGNDDSQWPYLMFYQSQEAADRGQQLWEAEHLRRTERLKEKKAPSGVQERIARKREETYAEDLADARKWIEKRLSPCQPDRVTGQILAIRVFQNDLDNAINMKSRFQENGFAAFLDDLIELLARDGFILRLEQRYVHGRETDIQNPFMVFYETQEAADIAERLWQAEHLEHTMGKGAKFRRWLRRLLRLEAKPAEAASPDAAATIQSPQATLRQSLVRERQAVLSLRQRLEQLGESLANKEQDVTNARSTVDAIETEMEELLAQAAAQREADQDCDVTSLSLRYSKLDQEKACAFDVLDRAQHAMARTSLDYIRWTNELKELEYQIQAMLIEAELDRINESGREIALSARGMKKTLVEEAAMARAHLEVQRAAAEPAETCTQDQEYLAIAARNSLLAAVDKAPTPAGASHTQAEFDGLNRTAADAFDKLLAARAAARPQSSRATVRQREAAAVQA